MQVEGKLNSGHDETGPDGPVSGVRVRGAGASQVELRRFVRFLLVGGLNTLFGYSAYALLLLVGLALPVALAGSNVLGILFNFFATGRFVFGDSDLKLLPKFAAAYGLSWLLSWFLIGSLTALHPRQWLEPWIPEVILGLVSDRPGFRDRLYAAGLLLPVTTIITYLCLRFGVYRNKTKSQS